jgi:hypothetical protein
MKIKALTFIFLIYTVVNGSILAGASLDRIEIQMGPMAEQFIISQPHKPIVLKTTLISSLPDKTQLKVHFMDTDLDRIKDPNYPYRVLALMKEAHTLLTHDLGYQSLGETTNAIDIYLADAEKSPVFPFEGFHRDDFKRAPIFLVKKDVRTGQKRRVILIPMDYGKFVKIWDHLNHVPLSRDRHPDRDLAGSVMHEMTHAFLHEYHENLGSTEFQIHNGDWYTEGLARYYETKIGSLSGFSALGFRKKVDDKIQFSRGGANYYLKYPDETFFTLRYENALFWLYFEKTFGHSKVVELTHDFKDLPFDASFSQYILQLEKVTQTPFEKLLNGYFSWIYEKGYKTYSAGAYLHEVAAAKTIWKNGEFYWKENGETAGETLKADWISSWGDVKAKGFDDRIAGDGTSIADVRPLAMDVHEIQLLTSASQISVRTQGSAQMNVTLYLYDEEGGFVKKEASNGQATRLLNSNRVGVVISNLDTRQIGRYEIDIE